MAKVPGPTIEIRVAGPIARTMETLNLVEQRVHRHGLTGIRTGAGLAHGGAAITLIWRTGGHPKVVLAVQAPAMGEPYLVIHVTAGPRLAANHLLGPL